MILFPHMSNLVDASATVITTNGTPVAGMTEANVADQDLSEVYRHATIATTRNVIFDLGSALPVRAVAVIGVNDQETGTGISVEGDDENTFTAPPADSGFSHPQSTHLVDASGWPFLHNWYHYFATDQTFQHWQVRFNDPTNTDGFVQIRRILFGAAIVVTGDYSRKIGYKQSIQDSSVVTTMRDGSDQAEIGVSRRHHMFTCDRFQRTDHRQLIDWGARQGIHRDLVVLPAEDENQDDWAYEGLYGRFARPFSDMLWIEGRPLGPTSQRFYNGAFEIVERTIG